ncbi:hypothetical protein D081_1099 [Anaerovibrio sp. JC8]|uniref:tetratricopeptide repeat protein n=1 Tax=Anaerovibrio sp. JC8 TaxID=1240085 RepID=UPI000A0E760A|nr:tetratricopeptide repeat protein [Anaerovibrio sp. JC8]ORU00576.1 hypothetical protein D081_1099 [Anaerovibrio sp. JC8]
MAELKEVPFYQSASSRYSDELVQEAAAKAADICVEIAVSKGIRIDSLSTSVSDLNRYFLSALQCLQKSDYREALRRLQIYASYGDNIFQYYPHLYYYRGLAYYGLHEFDKAQADLAVYLKTNPNDEVGYFHLGNAYIRQKNIEAALDAYTEALKNRSNFDEILFNANIIDEKITAQGDSLGCESWPIMESPLTETLKIVDSLDIWDIPIFINSFNRLGCLQKLVNWLLNAGYRRIYILDNDSGYGPLLEYYDQLEQQEKYVQVLRLGQNMGHEALWDSGILEKLNIDGPYVYTDSDVVPGEQCPNNVLQHLLNILRKYPFLKKVGLGLITDDITFFDSEKIRIQEKSFYLHKMENDLYFGSVDTTFALYRNYRHYNIYVSARTTGIFMARHLPWYYDYNNLPEDEQYYVEHANTSAGLVVSLKGRGIT